MPEHPQFIAVIGASAGGLNALCGMVHHFPEGLDVAYCIVLHLSRKGVGDFVVHRLSQSTSLRCMMARQGQAVERDIIYVARPDQHLLVKDNHFQLGSGPEENRWRPSIDVLFRSAAVAFSSHTIGIILSGLLDDGTSGMWAIKRSGGVCIVQDPNQAEYPDMPVSVINHMEVDHVAALADMGSLIAQAVRHANPEQMPVPADVQAESRIAEQVAIGIADVKRLDVQQSPFACPDCGGGLWEVNGDLIKRYRCHIGHAYSERDLVIKQTEVAGTTLWVALRMMEERKHLLRKMDVDYQTRGYTHLVISNNRKQEELEGHITVLKKILFDLQNQDTD